MYRDLRLLVSLYKKILNNYMFISSARSPVYSHISATIQGLSSIRAFHEENKVLNKFHFYQNEHTKAWYMKIVTSRWFGMRIDLIGSSFLTIITLSSIPLADSKYIHYNRYMHCIHIAISNFRSRSSSYRIVNDLCRHFDWYVSALHSN